MNKIYYTAVCICFGVFAQAQTLQDAIRYTRQTIGGTARSIGVGGSMSAIGADYSVLSLNPAGLGAYRKNQYVFTLGYQNARSTSDFTNSNSAGLLIARSKNNININNAGYVSVNRPLGRKWKTTNWTIGLNRLANFNQTIEYSGISEGSLADRFLETAVDNGINDPWGDQLADEVGMIYTVEDDQGTFITNDVPVGALLSKSQRIERRGAMQELMIGLGGNYKEKFLLGASLGFPFIRYEETKSYTENDRNADIPVYQSIVYEESLKTDGTGIHAKVGVIFMPSIDPRNWAKVRLGLAIQTPTSFVLTDEFTADLSYRAQDLSDPNNPFNGGTAESPLGESEYNFNTPWRFSGGAGLILGRKGFVSTDIEYLNYGATGFDLNLGDGDPANQAFEDALNKQIEDGLQSALNIRLGGELALHPFRLRAGYQLLGASRKDGDPQQLLSAGIGFNTGRFYIDLAVRQSVRQERYLPYTSRFSDDPVIAIEARQLAGFLTVGFR